MAPQSLLEIHFRVKREKRRELTQSLESLRAVRPPGQLLTSVYEDTSGSDQYIWVEEWSDDQMLEGYLVSNGFRAVLGGLRALGSVVDYRIVELNDSATTEPRRTKGRRLAFEDRQ